MDMMRKQRSSEHTATGIGADEPVTASRLSKRSRRLVLIGALVVAVGGGTVTAGVLTSGNRAGPSWDKIEVRQPWDFARFFCEYRGRPTSPLPDFPKPPQDG
jgi:hypothetical protein